MKMPMGKMGGKAMPPRGTMAPDQEEPDEDEQATQTRPPSAPPKGKPAGNRGALLAILARKRRGFRGAAQTGGGGYHG